MNFKKGDTVIYPQHGACIVHGIKKMKAFGATQEYLILKTVINEMTLSVPTSKAADVGVRPPVSPDELEDLVSVLSKADPRVPSNWSRRFKNQQEKLKSGDVYQVAEVVRNLAARNRDASLSAAERTMYDRARINLISEIAPALKVSTEEAEAFLDEALAKGVLKPAKAKKAAAPAAEKKAPSAPAADTEDKPKAPVKKAAAAKPKAETKPKAPTKSKDEAKPKAPSKSGRKKA
ncbi:MAG: CarD family transcriptional regulator [Actinomycetota bacterium]